MLGRAKRVMIEKENTTIIDGAGWQGRDPGPDRADQGADRGDHLGLRPREAAGAAGEAGRRRGGDPGRRLRPRSRSRSARTASTTRCTRPAPRSRRVSSPGGGVALLRAIKALEGVKPANDDQRVGVEIVRKALQWPARQIAENAGLDGAVVVGKLLESHRRQLGLRRPGQRVWRPGRPRRHRPGQGGAHGAAGRGLGRRPADHHRGDGGREAEEGDPDAGRVAGWAAWATWTSDPIPPRMQQRGAAGDRGPVALAKLPSDQRPGLPPMRALARRLHSPGAWGPWTAAWVRAGLAIAGSPARASRPPACRALVAPLRSAHHNSGVRRIC